MVGLKKKRPIMNKQLCRFLLLLLLFFRNVTMVLKNLCHCTIRATFCDILPVNLRKNVLELLTNAVGHIASFYDDLHNTWFCYVAHIDTIKSSDTGGRIFRILGGNSMLKSPVNQQAWYWLCRTDNNMYCCSRVNFIYLGPAKFKIWFKLWIHLSWFLKQFSILRAVYCQLGYYLGKI